MVRVFPLINWVSQSFLIVAINLQVDVLRGWMGLQLRESA